MRKRIITATLGLLVALTGIVAVNPVTANAEEMNAMQQMQQEAIANGSYVPDTSAADANIPWYPTQEAAEAAHAEEQAQAQAAADAINAANAAANAEAERQKAIDEKIAQLDATVPGWRDVAGNPVEQMTGVSTATGASTQPASSSSAATQSAPTSSASSAVTTNNGSATTSVKSEATTETKTDDTKKPASVSKKKVETKAKAESEEKVEEKATKEEAATPEVKEETVTTSKATKNVGEKTEEETVKELEDEGNTNVSIVTRVGNWFGGVFKSVAGAWSSFIGFFHK